LAPTPDRALLAAADVAGLPDAPAIQVNEAPVPEVQLVAARPAWVRVRSADGSVIFILNAANRARLWWAMCLWGAMRRFPCRQ